MKADIPDDELIRRINQKDHAAFQELVERYQAMVHSVCFNLLRDLQQAEDVSQEVFFQIYKHAGKFRYESKVSSWLYRIAVNRSLNLIRRNRRSRWFSSLSAFGAEEDIRGESVSDLHLTLPDLAFEEKERREFLQKAIDALPPKQRVPFVLNKCEGFGSREIAEVLQIPLTAVEARLRRAKVGIKNKLIAFLDKKDS